MMRKRNRGRRVLAGFGAFVLAGCIWAPSAHLLFDKDLANYRSEAGVSPVAGKLAAAHLAVWTNPGLRKVELDRMREVNPEWDFMSRTYFVLALVNMGLRDPEYAGEACAIIDAIIDNTVAVERENGFEHYLMAYGRHGGWVVDPPGSLFVDGEITLMMGARRLLEEKDSYRQPLRERVDAMVSRMRESPVLAGESYPDECWLFCNTVALAAIRMADVLDGTDHSEFLAAWVEAAKRELVDPKTGILISAYDVNGSPSASGFTPEGSTIWMASHMLQIVDGEFADDQYRRARAELARSFLGFGYSREWPEGVDAWMDVDSGPVIPGLGASASASGLAIMAAAAFDDDEFLRSLLASLEFAGFPGKRDGALRYQASNQVGDAVLLYALAEGPLWDLVRERGNS